MSTLGELLPAGSWVVLTHAQRTLQRAAQTHVEAEALAGAIDWPGPTMLAPLEAAIRGPRPAPAERVHRGTRSRRSRAGGPREGNPGELANGVSSEPWPTAPGSCSSAAVTVRCSGPPRSSAISRPSGSRRRSSPASSSRRAGSPSSPRRISSVPDATRGPRRGSRSRSTTGSVAEELEPGDFAVHRIHGVARYGGVVHRELAGAERDYLLLEYASNDRLYVPSEQVGMVAKYLGGDAPRLHRLGSSDWARATAKVKRAVKDMAGELVRLYSARMAIPGHAFGPDTPWQRELEDAFPYEETPRPGHRDRRGQGGHGAAGADGPAGLRRRRIRQDRDRRPRRLQSRDGRQAGRRPGADHPARRAALRDVRRTVRAVSGEGRDALSLPVTGATEGGRRGCWRPAASTW